MLFNEPKLLKSYSFNARQFRFVRFSALQRAEIAEMVDYLLPSLLQHNVSVLFNEPKLLKSWRWTYQNQDSHVSVLFNEPKLLKFNLSYSRLYDCNDYVSVLFNEPKLLKSIPLRRWQHRSGVSVLFNEPKLLKWKWEYRSRKVSYAFQCSSTSRNC